VRSRGSARVCKTAIRCTIKRIDAEAVKKIVMYPNVVAVFARLNVVGATKDETSASIKDFVESDYEIVNRTPSTSSGLVSGRDNYGTPTLRARPVIVQHVSFYYDALGVLELQ